MKQALKKKFYRAGRYFSGFANAGSGIAFCLLIGIGVFLFAGFIRFSIIVANYDNSTEPEADGIVVLTGGKSRIETGLRLLKQGRAKRLLISGVHRNTSAKVIVSRFSTHTDLFSCCIDLDHIAMDTTQNGLQTAKWIKNQGFDSVIVVTSDYHMPRSLLEMSRAMPDILLLPYAARGGQTSRKAGIGNSVHLRVMVREFIKTIAASFNSKDDDIGNQNTVAN